MAGVEKIPVQQYFTPKIQTKTSNRSLAQGHYNLLDDSQDQCGIWISYLTGAENREQSRGLVAAVPSSWS
jgi:hypothetical protein